MATALQRARTGGGARFAGVRARTGTLWCCAHHHRPLHREIDCLSAANSSVSGDDPVDEEEGAVEMDAWAAESPDQLQQQQRQSQRQ